MATAVPESAVAVVIVVRSDTDEKPSCSRGKDPRFGGAIDPSGTFHLRQHDHWPLQRRNQRRPHGDHSLTRYSTSGRAGACGKTCGAVRRGRGQMVCRERIYVCFVRWVIFAGLFRVSPGMNVATGKTSFSRGNSLIVTTCSA